MLANNLDGSEILNLLFNGKSTKLCCIKRGKTLTVDWLTVAKPEWLAKPASVG